LREKKRKEKAPTVPNGTAFNIYRFSTQQMFLRNKTNKR